MSILSHLVLLRQVLFECPSLICLFLGFLSLILNLIALPPSPTSPSPTQAPLVAPVLPMAGLIMHRNVLIALLRFHLHTLADTILCFSQYISTYSNGALNPPRVVASAVASVGVETVVPPLPTLPAVYPIIYLRPAIEKHRSPNMYGAHAHASNTQRNSNSNSNSNPNHFHQHHCECRWDCSLFDDRQMYGDEVSAACTLHYF